MVAITPILTIIVWIAGGTNDAPDIRSVAADLQVPELTADAHEAGRRFKETLPAYDDTQVYHVTYLPVDWQPDGRYPVIVEYAGNGNYRSPHGDISSGLVEGSKLGYGMSSGSGFIWVCLPYLNAAGDKNVRQWWGDDPQFEAQPTVDYCLAAVPWICEKYGGDRDRVILAGFSRGAIAVNFIGLHNDEVAKLWRGFVAYSHYDGVVERWPYPGCDRQSAKARLSRLGDRPQFICGESGRGKQHVDVTRAYLESTGINGRFEYQDTGFRNHNDEWILRPSEARTRLRKWLAEVVE